MNTTTAAAPEGFRHGTLTELADRDFWFYGTDRPPDTDPQHVTSVVRDSKHLQFVLYTAEGELVRFGIRKNVWMGPVPRTAPVRTRRPNQPCRCGCGAVANGRRGSLYLQGHDARHVSQLVARIFSDSDVNLADLTDELAELPTQALRDKASRMIERRVAVAA